MRFLSLPMVGVCGVAALLLGCSATGSGGGGPTDEEGGGGNYLPGSSGNVGVVPVDPYGNPLNLGTETICNGLDDNSNGVIDDVDAAKDGICDCLAVATMGWPKSPGASAADANVGSFTAWLEARGSRPPLLLADQEITADSLAGIQVLIVQNISQGAVGREYSSDEHRVIADWVNRGGGVMTMAGYTANASDAAGVNALLAQIGGLQYDLSSGGSGFLQDGEKSVPILEWNAAHPIAKGVTAVGVYYGYPVAGAIDGVVTEWVAAHAGLGNPGYAGATAKVGAGHVFVWSDEWITFTKDWTTRTDYSIPKFMANAMMWLTPATMCQVTIPDSPPPK